MHQTESEGECISCGRTNVALFKGAFCLLCKRLYGEEIKDTDLTILAQLVELIARSGMATARLTQAKKRATDSVTKRRS